jgi:hypothetical protein
VRCPSCGSKIVSPPLIDTRDRMTLDPDSPAALESEFKLDACGGAGRVGRSAWQAASTSAAPARPMEDERAVERFINCPHLRVGCWSALEWRLKCGGEISHPPFRNVSAHQPSLIARLAARDPRMGTQGGPVKRKNPALSEADASVVDAEDAHESSTRLTARLPHVHEWFEISGNRPANLDELNREQSTRMCSARSELR